MLSTKSVIKKNKGEEARPVASHAWPIKLRTAALVMIFFRFRSDGLLSAYAYYELVIGWPWLVLMGIWLVEKNQMIKPDINTDGFDLTMI
jgi:hypothetical protein